MSVTLIFPSSTPQAITYDREAHERGEKIIAASSLSQDPHFETWFHLPTIYEEHFITKLNELIENHDVSKIFCTSASVYHHLKAHLPSHNSSLKLIGDSPIERQQKTYKELLAAAAKSQKVIESISGLPSKLSLFEIAGVLRLFSDIYGECDEGKLFTLMGIFPLLPKGDVIEIGSFFGKSAFALNYLSTSYEIGSALVVDPWRVEDAVQKESPKFFQELSHEWNWGRVFESFCINLIPLAKGSFNYLRLPSSKAYDLYQSSRPINSKEFGETQHTGKIALLHIDGNHDYSAVKEDYTLWRPAIVPGGWVILDDYVWSHGDGPKRLGDEILKAESHLLKRSFVSGNALYLGY